MAGVVVKRVEQAVGAWCHCLNSMSAAAGLHRCHHHCAYVLKIAGCTRVGRSRSNGDGARSNCAALSPLSPEHLLARARWRGASGAY